jgi:hypothetical protein
LTDLERLTTPQAPVLEGEAEQASGLVLGYYLLNRSLIQIERSDSIWIDQPGDSVHRFAVFIHEYLHYLHNYSTVAGITYFITHIRLARLFINSAGADGYSRGAAALDPGDNEDYRELLAWRRHLRGDSGLPFRTDALPPGWRVRVLKARRRLATPVSFQNQRLLPEVAELDLQVESPGTLPAPATIVLGYVILTEGLAVEMEKLVHREAGRDEGVVDCTVPAFPYHVSRVAFEAITGHRPTSELLIKVCLLALQSADCGATFVELAEVYRDRPSHQTDDAFIETQTSNGIGYLAARIDKMFEIMVDPELDNFKSRGLLGEAIAYHKEQCRQYMQRRTKDPFFELALPAMVRGSGEELKNFFEESPPCIVRHTAAPGELSELFYLGTKERDGRHLQAMGTFQAFSQYLSFHLATSGLLPTPRVRSVAKDTSCFFFGGCAVPFALSHSATCATTPWESFAAQPGQGCWFASGVAATRGPAVA